MKTKRISRNQPRLLNQFGNLLQRDTPERTSAQRNAYEAAGNTLKNNHYWKDAHGQSFESALSTDKHILVNRIQHELRNNPYLKGIARKYSNFLVGQGALPRITCKEDKPWGREVERRFKTWEKNANFKAPESLNPNIRTGSLSSMLRLGAKGFFDYGEYFMMPQTDRASSGANKLKFLLINPRRVRTPHTFQAANGNRIVNGVEIDRSGRPVKYWISKEDTRNTAFTTSTSISFSRDEFQAVDARLMIHHFEEDDPDQYRGMPWHAQSLNITAMTRHFKESTLSAAEMQSLLATFLTCDNPDLIGDQQMIDIEKYGVDQFIEDIIPGTMNTMPVGYKVDHTNPTHPNTQYREFVNQNYGEISSGSCDMPLSIANSDTSDSNFASGKMDSQHFGKNLDTVRDEMEERTMNRIFDMWLMEEQLLPKNSLPQTRCDFSIKWIWQEKANFIDEEKKAKSRAINLKNGIETLSEIHMQDHKDPTDMRESLVEEKEWMDENGFTFDIVKVNETVQIDGGVNSEN